GAELFVEIQCEELPARFVDDAAAQLEAGVLALLDGVPHGEVKRYASPRHVAVCVSDVAVGKPTTERLVTGPPAEKACVDGKPTAMAHGFAKGKGVSVDALQLVDTPKGQVIAAMVQEGGERSVALIAAGLEHAILGMSFPK